MSLITPTKVLPATPFAHKTPSEQLYFCRRSAVELREIKDLVDVIKSGLAPERDNKDATVYVIKARDTDMTKVGYTSQGEVSRVEQHLKQCKIELHKMYQPPGFYGAHKAEQIVHKLLRSSCFELYGCHCKTIHKEWFQKSFLDVVTMVQLVCNWVQQQEPYHSVASKTDREACSVGELKQEWSESLDQWYETQKSEAPLEWNEFFLRHTKYWRPYQIQLTLRQRRKDKHFYSPKAQRLNNSDAKKHRPTGCFDLSSPSGTCYHAKVTEQRTEVETVPESDGKKTSRTKREQKFSSEDIYTNDSNGSRTRLHDQVETTPCPSPVQRGFARRSEEYGDFVTSDEDDNDHGDKEYIPQEEDEPIDENNESHSDSSTNQSGQHSDHESLPDSDYRSPSRSPRTANQEPSINTKPRQNDNNPASDPDDTDFVPARLTRRPTMQEDIKAGARKLFDTTKTAARGLKKITRAGRRMKSNSKVQRHDEEILEHESSEDSEQVPLRRSGRIRGLLVSK